MTEGLGWARPDTWKRFSIADQAPADTTRSMACNQGVDNLFLDIRAALGLLLWFTGHEGAGKTLVLFSAASMWRTASVLVTTGRSHLRAALTHGTLPFIGFLLFL